MSRGTYHWNINELVHFLDTNDVTVQEFAGLVGKSPRLIQYVIKGHNPTTHLGTLKKAKERFPKAGYDASAIEKIFMRRVKD